MRKTISVILCLCIIMTITGCGEKNDNQVAGFKYYHYETTEFHKALAKLDNLADTESSEKIIKLYDKLYDQCIELDSLYTVAYIKHSTDTADEYYDKEQLYCYKTLVEMEDALCEICRRITRGPSAGSFREHVGEQAFDYFYDYDVMSSREKKLVKREQKLIDEYYDTYDQVDSRGVRYNHENWTMDDLSGSRGTDLAWSDYDSYLNLYYKLTGSLNRATGPIFIELVQLRDELAEINGFENYADYADQYIYSRDYSGEDLKPFYKEIKEISRIFNKNYYAAMSVGMEASYPELSERQLLKNLEKYSGKVSKLAGKSCNILLKQKLYNIGDDESRQNISFTSVIAKTGKPFICITMDHENDFAILTHEFGHFVQFNAVKQNNILADRVNMDLAEVASNGFNGLMIHYYEDIFDEEADSAARYALGDLLLNVIEGSTLDEFQREVYANPDMNLGEINSTYSKIAAEYDKDLKGDPGYNWVYVPHNFDSPMYYVSYAASGLASLQIWNKSRKDYSGAVKTWEKITRIGSYNKDYMAVLEECGLIKFTDAGAAMKICRPALKATKVNAGLQ